MSSENSTSLKDPSEFTIWESILRTQLGLHKDAIRELRQKHLQENAHWKLDGNRVVYSQAGVAALKNALSIPAVPQPENAAPGNEQAQKNAPENAAVELISFRPARGNHFILEANLPEKDPLDPRNRVRVRVRSNVNFVRGMKLKAVLVAGYSDYYELVGPCPRSRGRW